MLWVKTNVQLIPACGLSRARVFVPACPHALLPLLSTVHFAKQKGEGKPSSLWVLIVISFEVSSWVHPWDTTVQCVHKAVNTLYWCWKVRRLSSASTVLWVILYALLCKCNATGSLAPFHLCIDVHLPFPKKVLYVSFICLCFSLSVM